MEPSELFRKSLARVPVIAILRGFSAKESAEHAVTAWKRGVQLVEVPIQDSAGREALLAVAEEAKRHGREFGAGTVLTLDDLDFAESAGCSFTVSPGLSLRICKAASERRIAHLPGVATASEISTALELGLTWLKAFPAKELGPSWIAAQLGPFPTVRFVATGGIDGGNAQSFLDAGAFALGVGKAIADAQFLPRDLRIREG